MSLGTSSETADQRKAADQVEYQENIISIFKARKDLLPVNMDRVSSLTWTDVYNNERKYEANSTNDMRNNISCNCVSTLQDDLKNSAAFGDHERLVVELVNVEKSARCPDESKINDNLEDESELLVADSVSCRQNNVTEFNESDYRLDTLPVEVLLHILSFLDGRFIVSTLAQVCTGFSNIIHDQIIWKNRMRRLWPGRTYPAIPNESLDWMESCVQREEQQRHWNPRMHNMNYYRYNGGIYGAVDTVHLMQNGRFLAAGSRDKYLTLLDLDKIDPENADSVRSCSVFVKENAHAGWIWSMSSFDGVLATGSWDSYVKFWDLETQSEVRNIKTKSAVLSTHFERDLLAVGGYDKHVYQIDPRSAGILERRLYHRKPVLCLAADDHYIVTGSEDNTVVVFDRRADRVCKSIRMKEFPMSMSYVGSELWVGNKAGQLSLIDATNGNFSFVETYNIGHQGKVTGVVHTAGATFTSSTDKTIKVFEPSTNPRLIASLTEHASDIAEISFQNGVLACACSGFCIGIYIPKERT